MAETDRIAELIDRLARIVHGMQFADGLNPAQWEAVRFVARANRHSRTPGALAEYLGTTKGTASQTLIALESKGYIRRARCPNDRRSVEIDLTDRGRELCDNDPLELLCQTAGALSAADQGALAAGLERLNERLAETQDRATFGRCVNCTHYLTGCAELTGGQEPCRCSLTGEPMAPEELFRICVDYQPAA